MYVLRTMNSLRMSFWIVPESSACETPCSSAATMYAASTGRTAPFIVMDTETSPRGMSAKSSFMSSTVSTATPAMPTSPATRGSSES